MNWNMILRIAAVLCFLLSAFGVPAIGGVALVTIGLAFFAGSFLP